MKLLTNVVRKASGEEFVENDAQRVDVAACVEFQRIGKDLLRTHVGERTDKLPGVRLHGRLRVAIGDAGDAKVENLGLPGFIHQDIARFEIAMNQSALMRVMDGIANLNHDLEPLERI